MTAETCDITVYCTSRLRPDLYDACGGKYGITRVRPL